jgi:hypothetical protein
MNITIDEHCRLVKINNIHVLMGKFSRPKDEQNSALWSSSFQFMTNKDAPTQRQGENKSKHTPIKINLN